jgi:hypothetical protein
VSASSDVNKSRCRYLTCFKRLGLALIFSLIPLAAVADSEIDPSWQK